jgi:hypothetical protein
VTIRVSFVRALACQQRSAKKSASRDSRNETAAKAQI